MQRRTVAGLSLILMGFIWTSMALAEPARVAGVGMGVLAAIALVTGVGVVTDVIERRDSSEEDIGWIPDWVVLVCFTVGLAMSSGLIGFELVG